MTTLYTGPNIKDYCWNAGEVYREYGLGPDMRCNEASQRFLFPLRSGSLLSADRSD